MTKMFNLTLLIIASFLIFAGFINLNVSNAKENKNTNKTQKTKVSINELKKQGKKYYFKSYSPDSSKKKYVKIVWNWMAKENSEGKIDYKKLKELSSTTFEPQASREFIFADFNNDKKEDFIVLPGGAYYCAPGGTHGCEAFIFLGPDFKKVIDFSSIYESLPERNVLYILKTSTNGFRDVITNGKFLCKYDTENKNYKFYLCLQPK